MEEPNIPEVVKRLQAYSQDLKDNAQYGNSKLMLAFAEMITMMGWTSKQEERYSVTLIRLTRWIVALTVVLVVGLVVQIVLAFIK